MSPDHRRLLLTAVAAVVLVLATGAVYAAGTPAEPTAQAGSELDGKTVFGVRGCLACHQAPGMDGGNVGPSLRSVAQVAGDRVDGLDAAEYIRQSIRRPEAFVVPGFSPMMPTLGLTDEEIDAVVTFLLGSE